MTRSLSPGLASICGPLGVQHVAGHNHLPVDLYRFQFKQPGVAERFPLGIGGPASEWSCFAACAAGRPQVQGMVLVPPARKASSVPMSAPKSTSSYLRRRESISISTGAPLRLKTVVPVLVGQPSMLKVRMEVPWRSRFGGNAAVVHDQVAALIEQAHRGRRAGAQAPAPGRSRASG